jgi:predicted MarR family transcription regulator
MPKATKSTPVDEQESEPDAIFDTPWHLCQTAEELPITMIENSLIRTAAAFDRWMAECQGAAAHVPMSSTDNLVLNAIRMREVPKGLSELGRFLNRDDISNIQYSLRKLQAAGLIEKHSSRKRRTTSYQVTKKGAKVTDEFARLRRKLLITSIPSLRDWEEQVGTAIRVLQLMQSVYENASVALMFSAPADDQTE